MERLGPRAFEFYRESAQKFDYYVMGLTGALVAYMSQNLKPEHLGLNSYTLGVTSLLAMVGSIFFAFLRMERGVLVEQVNHALIHALDDQKAMMEALTAKEPGIELPSGKPYTPAQLNDKVEQQAKVIERYKNQLERSKAPTRTWYLWRNGLLAGGFLGMLASRISAPYW